MRQSASHERQRFSRCELAKPLIIVQPFLPFRWLHLRKNATEIGVASISAFIFQVGHPLFSHKTKLLTCSLKHKSRRSLLLPTNSKCHPLFPFNCSFASFALGFRICLIKQLSSKTRLVGGETRLTFMWKRQNGFLNFLFNECRHQHNNQPSEKKLMPFFVNDEKL